MRADVERSYGEHLLRLGDGFLEPSHPRQVRAVVSVRVSASGIELQGASKRAVGRRPVPVEEDRGVAQRSDASGLYLVLL